MADSGAAPNGHATANGAASAKKKSRTRDDASNKRRCVSTACIACRRRKSKCDGQTPKCAACQSVYGTGELLSLALHERDLEREEVQERTWKNMADWILECQYDPLSDHRRKGVYKEKIDSLKTRNSTLQTLIQAILNAAEDDVAALVKQIRTCESLDEVADNIMRQEQGRDEEEYGDEDEGSIFPTLTSLPTFETELSGKMGELRLENGSVRFLGGTSNLIYLDPTLEDDECLTGPDMALQQQEPLLSWTTVTQDTEVVVHLINMYFTWHYPYFTTLSKSLFYRDFLLGKPSSNHKSRVYCSSLLVSPQPFSF